jgi:queuine tRNA-ribosyltransferase
VSLEFNLLTTTEAGGRRGRIDLPHRTVETPVFMPVGTAGTVKAVAQDVLESLGAEIILGNTYHLYLRPGHEAIRRMGGLHRFISWPRAMLFTPEHSMDVQIALGADICMAFDECTEYPADRNRAEESLRLTMAWARRSLDHFKAHRDEVVWRDELGGQTQNLFGIVQGGMYRDLRRESVERLVEMDFDGYAIGGLSVGEPRELTMEMIAEVLPLLPADKPRYVMGVGYPDEIEAYARMGVDMMDCVLPTRAARHGLLFTSEGRLNIKGKKYAEDQGPPDPNCNCMVCRRYTRAYLRHLIQAGEALSGTLNSIHNLAYYLGIMERVRKSLVTEALAPREI